MTFDDRSQLFESIAAKFTTYILQTAQRVVVLPSESCCWVSLRRNSKRLACAECSKVFDPEKA